MKKIICSFLLVCIASAFVSCSSSQTSEIDALKAEIATLKTDNEKLNGKYDALVEVHESLRDIVLTNGERLENLSATLDATVDLVTITEEQIQQLQDFLLGN